MVKLKTLKMLGISLLSIVAAQAVADQQNSGQWGIFSDPTAIYSKVGMAGGTEGVDLYGALGGYLGGQFKHQLSVEAMHDLDYYNVNYLAFNTSNDTGFTLDTTWGDRYDKAAIGVTKKLTLEDKRINLYPSMDLGLLWGTAIDSTTYIEFELPARFSVDRALWFGVTPSYTYSLKGLNIKEFHATIDVGYQLGKEIAVSAHANDDDQVWADFTFAF